MNRPPPGASEVRVADASDPRDVSAAARLLHDFNVEFDSPTPPVTDLAVRVGKLIGAGDTVVLLVSGSSEDEQPAGVGVLRFRMALWSAGLESYLAELYVVPSRRGRGLGRSLLEHAIALARGRGADTMDLGTGEDDLAARALYESLGFTHREGGPDGPVNYCYELDLSG
jgi:ribosomal protein S18 acetylase RimI-like enzyme